MNPPFLSRFGKMKSSSSEFLDSWRHNQRLSTSSFGTCTGCCFGHFHLLLCARRAYSRKVAFLSWYEHQTYRAQRHSCTKRVRCAGTLPSRQRVGIAAFEGFVMAVLFHLHSSHAVA